MVYLFELISYLCWSCLKQIQHNWIDGQEKDKICPNENIKKMLFSLPLFDPIEIKRRDPFFPPFVVILTIPFLSFILEISNFQTLIIRSKKQSFIFFANSYFLRFCLVVIEEILKVLLLSSLYHSACKAVLNVWKRTLIIFSIQLLMLLHV